MSMDKYRISRNLFQRKENMPLTPIKKTPAKQVFFLLTRNECSQEKLDILLVNQKFAIAY